MTEEAPLIPIEERSVQFYEDEIVAVLVRINDQLVVYVPLRPLCRYLGLAWTGQHDRVRRDPVLSEALKSVRVTRTDSQGSKRGDPDVLCLPLEYIPGWLFGISSSRVKPELQERIIRYQRECFRVLWQAFQADLTPPVPETPSAGMTLSQVRDLGAALMQMAEQQMALEQRVDSVDVKADTAHERLDHAVQVFNAMRRRVGKLEDKLHPHAYITEEQAAHVSTVVKALAEMLTRQEKGKNHYQGIFGELHRRFGVPSYKHIRQEQYADVLAFLDDWRDAAMGGRERQDEETGDA
jgi:hypothetical protein